jgi:hypothetical protein
MFFNFQNLFAPQIFFSIFAAQQMLLKAKLVNGSRSSVG